jgi:predicted transposase YbfD/YdcC
VRPLEPMGCGLPQVRSLVTVHKRCEAKGRGKREAAGTGEAEDTVFHYVSSLPPGRAERFAGLVRGHWGGSEIRNHWVRDALFEEDGTRSKNLNLNGNLAVLRCALIALKARLAPEASWPELFERSSAQAWTPINLVHKNIFK